MPTSKKKDLKVQRVKKGERLDLRLSHSEKELLKRAAALRHEKVSDYVRVLILNEAKRFIEERESILLSDLDRDLLLHSLDNPPIPNEALRAAMEEYRKGVTE